MALAARAACQALREVASTAAAASTRCRVARPRVRHRPAIAAISLSTKAADASCLHQGATREQGAITVAPCASGAGGAVASAPCAAAGKLARSGEVVSLPTPVGGSCAQHAFRRLASGFTRDLEPSRAGKRRVGDADSKHVVLDDAARSAVLTAGVVDGIATPWVAEKELVAFEFLRAALRRASLHGVGLHATGEWVRERMLKNRAFDGGIRIVSDALSGIELALVVRLHRKALGSSGGFGVVVRSDARGKTPVVYLQLFGCRLVLTQQARPAQSEQSWQHEDLVEESRGSRISPTVHGRVQRFRRKYAQTLDRMAEAHGLESPDIEDVEVPSLEEDALESWFSVNALYYDIHTGAIEDPTGHGLEDLQAGVLQRHAPPPPVMQNARRWQLVGLSVAARLGFEISPEMWEYMHIDKSRTLPPAAPGTSDEFRVSLACPNFHRVIACTHVLGLRHVGFPVRVKQQCPAFLATCWSTEHWEEGVFRVAVVQSAFPHAVPFDDERVLTEERSTLMMSELATMTNLPQAIPIAALLSPMLGKWDHYDDPQSLEPTPLESVANVRSAAQAWVDLKRRRATCNIRPFSAYPVYVLQLGQPAGHLVTQICRAFLVMPEVPPANHSCFQSEDWPRRLVAANPLHWGLWLRDVGDQWRVIIRIAMVLREAARLDRPPLEEYAGEAFTRQGEDLPPMELALKCRAHGDELVAWLEDSGFLDAAQAPLHVNGADVATHMQGLARSQKGAVGEAIARVMGAASMWSLVQQQAPGYTPTGDGDSDADPSELVWEWIRPILTPEVVEAEE